MTVTIANGASLSGAVELQFSPIAGFLVPSSWTTANLTFQASVDGTNYFNVYDDLGTEVTVVATANAFITAYPQFDGVKYLKVRSGTSGTPVNQGGDRIITVIPKAHVNGVEVY